MDRFTRMEIMAKYLTEKYGLDLESVDKPRAYLAQLRQSPSMKSVKLLPNGRESWGPDLTYDITSYMCDHESQLMEDYPLERIYWPAAFRDLALYTKRLPQAPWLAWHRAIMGRPYPDWPREWPWRALMHVWWLEESRAWRDTWEKQFLARCPDAERREVFEKGAAAFERWRYYAFSNGIKATEGLWERDAMERLIQFRELAGVLR